jgi:hypothetical protein
MPSDRAVAVMVVALHMIRVRHRAAGAGHKCERVMIFAAPAWARDARLPAVARKRKISIPSPHGLHRSCTRASSGASEGPRPAGGNLWHGQAAACRCILSDGQLRVSVARRFGQHRWGEAGRGPGRLPKRGKAMA